MNKLKQLEQLLSPGVVAVIRNSRPATINDLVGALLAGGITSVEITVEKDGGLESIKTIKQSFGSEVLIGAGTVLDAVTAKLAMDAGADFIVSPIFKQELIEMTNRYGKISIPGAMTPTEILTAYELGADMVKVFPAGTLGSKYLKDLSGPLGHIPIMTTGGINASNAGEFIRNGASCIGVGGSLVNPENELTQVTKLAQQLVQEVEQARKN